MQSLDTAIFDPTKFDFRNNHWGDLNEDVIKSEGIDHYANVPHAIAYKRTLENSDFSTMYAFGENGLRGGLYSLDTTFIDMDQYIKLYFDLFSKMETYLGQPDEYEEQWHTTKKVDRSKWGIAISKGNLSLSAVWITSSNQIVLSLDNSERPCNLSLAYGKPNS